MLRNDDEMFCSHGEFDGGWEFALTRGLVVDG